MKTLFVVLLPVVLLSGCIMTMRTAGERKFWAQETVRHWSNYARASADAVIEEYGPPDAIESGRLAWYNKGPWKTVEVWDEPAFVDSLVGAPNVAHTVAYYVAPDRRAALYALHEVVTVTQDGRELRANSGSEELDFLALNLAHEVLQGYMTPDDAKHAYDRTSQLAVSGKSSPYMRGLLFAPEP